MRITPLTDDPARFKRLKNVIVDGKVHGVCGVKVSTDAVYLSLSDVSDRTSAEKFRGKYLLVARKDAVETEENSYFIADIIGCAVVNERGEKLCVVEDVISAKTDVFTAKTDDGKTVRFPFLKDALIKVDINAKTIIVKERRFGEISLYED